jgi:hypothetical protein
VLLEAGEQGGDSEEGRDNDAAEVVVIACFYRCSYTGFTCYALHAILMVERLISLHTSHGNNFEIYGPGQFC